MIIKHASEKVKTNGLGISLISRLKNVFATLSNRAFSESTNWRFVELK